MFVCSRRNEDVLFFFFYLSDEQKSTPECKLHTYAISILLETSLLSHINKLITCAAALHEQHNIPNGIKRNT